MNFILSLVVPAFMMVCTLIRLQVVCADGHIVLWFLSWLHLVTVLLCTADGQLKFQELIIQSTRDVYICWVFGCIYYYSDFA